MGETPRSRLPPSSASCREGGSSLEAGEPWVLFSVRSRELKVLTTHPRECARNDRIPLTRPPPSCGGEMHGGGETFAPGGGGRERGEGGGRGGGDAAPPPPLNLSAKRRVSRQSRRFEGKAAEMEGKQKVALTFALYQN